MDKILRLDYLKNYAKYTSQKTCSYAFIIKEFINYSTATHIHKLICSSIYYLILRNISDNSFVWIIQISEWHQGVRIFARIRIRFAVFASKSRNIKGSLIAKKTIARLPDVRLPSRAPISRSPRATTFALSTNSGIHLRDEYRFRSALT